MLLIISIIIIGIIVFFKLFYDSFLFAQDIKLLFFTLSSIELIFCFYIFLVINILFILTKNRKYFEDKEKILNLFILHIMLTSLLLIIGEYTLSIAVQFIFLLSVFKSRNILIYIYFSSINYSLLLLFGSSSFILYFLLLFVSIVFIFKEDIFLKIDEIISFVSIAVLLTFLHIKAEKFIYDIHIWLNLEDRVNYLNNEVVLILTAIHVSILVSILVKKKKS